MPATHSSFSPTRIKQLQSQKRVYKITCCEKNNYTMRAYGLPSGSYICYLSLVRWCSSTTSGRYSQGRVFSAIRCEYCAHTDKKKARGHILYASNSAFLDTRNFESKCLTCIWACRMQVEMIIDHWNPSTLAMLWYEENAGTGKAG